MDLEELQRIIVNQTEIVLKLQSQCRHGASLEDVQKLELAVRALLQLEQTKQSALNNFDLIQKLRSI